VKDNLGAAGWKFATFAVVCLVGVFALLAIFAQLRFGKEVLYRAHFANTSGLKTGDFVRIAGVEVGKVEKITMAHDATLTVEFGTDPSVVITEGSRAVIRWDNLIGDRYLGLDEGTGGTRTLPPGATIPLDRTAPALDLDALIGGFRPLFQALNPEQINTLSADLIAAFQGEGDTIGSFLTQTASITNTLADRDQLIGQVIDNLNVVLGTLGHQSQQLDKAVSSLSQLVDGLAARKDDIAAAVGNVNDAAAGVADLLAQARPPLQQIITQNDRASGIILADHDYVENLLDTLPDKYRTVAREGLYGDYFGFYLCELTLKLNGKGGQPVYVKAAGQTSGRCTPK
jgi:phospholipid/cholesterol/gamma-HCH transport system substrate-binding protein